MIINNSDNQTLRSKVLQRLKFMLLVAVLLAVGDVALSTPAQAAVTMRLPRHEGYGPIIDVLALGDSYTAGNGALKGGGNDGYYYKSPDDPRTDAEVRHKTLGETWKNPATIPHLTKGCFRNHNSYAEEYYRKIGSTGAFINGSCSGDTTMEMSLQTQHFTKAERDEFDLIFLSVGGNDVKFSTLVRHCFVGAADNGRLCKADLDFANEQIKGVVEKTKEAINNVATQFPNAKIVWAGYPGLDDEWDLALPYCPDFAWNSPENQFRLWSIQTWTGLGSNPCNGKELQFVYPARELRPIADKTAHLQAAAAEVLAKKLHGRLVYAGLFYWYSGRNIGSSDPWIRDESTTKYYEEWFHPTAKGHDQTAEWLIHDVVDLDPMLRKMVRRDMPRKSVVKVEDGFWYAVDGSGKFSYSATDFYQCEQPDRGYKLVNWPNPEQLKLIDADAWPSPEDQLHCDPNGINGGSILRQSDGTAWLVHYGLAHSQNRTHIPTGKMYNCLVGRGARVYNNVNLVTLSQFSVPSSLLAYYDPACPK